VTKLILDASSLICWSEELANDILFRELLMMNYSFILPQRVISEVDYDRLEKTEIAELIEEESDVREVPERMHQKFSERYIGLGEGEISVISIAQTFEEAEDCCCILDDKAARNTCERLGIPMKGQIGLVAKLINQEKIEKETGEEILENMVNGGTLLPENYKELLNNNT